VNAGSIDRLREAVILRKGKGLGTDPEEPGHRDAYVLTQLNLPAKEEAWLGLGEIRNAPSPHRREIRKAVDAIQSAYNPAQPGIQHIECCGRSVRVQKMLAGTRPVICVHRDDWLKVEQAVAEVMPSPAHVDDRLKTPPIARKNLTPGSDDLRRTGNSRGLGPNTDI